MGDWQPSDAAKLGDLVLLGLWSDGEDGGNGDCCRACPCVSGSCGCVNAVDGGGGPDEASGVSDVCE